ncbi:ubiquinone biosynthesis regulatory protein kinase UbiB [Entomomonas asaccharolytica]|uniref:Ubiquinone biosynthesis regulatory protein kinase UbiB n=1 Tax=Entomomonas asaccharolytica TaxID=2785331 RepID=A0A974NED8_9GAMM|nr:ubiquinone biosynthesis regulatory protein kinase UbiB [Entomomonas asaccharolytica]QQP85230.1 ubiquinone biosynthesis regulatory protein kinase UbiB [Entomomonas asaccharolytica]
MRLLAIRRLYKITKVVIKYRLDDLLFDITILPFGVRIFKNLLPWRWFRRKPLVLSRGERIRLALEELGPVFIKFGQMLSTRQDLIPPDIALALSSLQDNVPPFPAEQSIELIERQLGMKVEDAFSQFDIEPLASASIAQVHTAKLQTGEEVVVKVVRPNLKPIIQQDISWLYYCAQVAEYVNYDARRMHLMEVITDYEKTINDELDLQREGANLSQLRRNFENSELLYVPKVYWPLCRQQVLVMERIYGIAVNNVAQLNEYNVDLKALAERGVEIFFTQVLRDSFFHADMHPGNIMVDPTNPEYPRYIAIDGGIVGSLTPEDQDYVARNVFYFFKRDYRRVAQLHIDSGWVPPNTKINELEDAIRSVCEPIFERPLKDISFGFVLMRLFQIARRFNMEVQPQLVLLQKTLLNIEGLGRQLYPDLDLWTTAKPYLERWMRQRVGVKRVIADFRNQVEQMPHIAKMARNIIEHENRKIKLQQKNPLKHKKKDSVLLRLLGALLLAGGISLTITEGSSLQHWPNYLMLAVGIYLIIRRC